MQGFSKQNIWNMIKFYNFYSKNLKLQPLAGEISWSNNIIILEKCETDFQKEYYIKLSKKLHLSKRVLQNKIESHEFERVLSTNKTNNFDLTLEEEEQLELVQNTIKDSNTANTGASASRSSSGAESDTESVSEQNASFFEDFGNGFCKQPNAF